MAAVGAIGSVLSFVGQQNQARQYEKSSKEQARLLRISAERKMEVYRTNLRKLLSTQRSLYAKAGVDLSSGSPILVAAETASEGQKELKYISETGESTSNLAESQGRSEASAARTQSYATLLSNLANLYNFYKPAG